MNSEAECDSRIWFYFPLPLCRDFCTKQGAICKCYTMQRQHLPRERSLWGGSAPREGTKVQWHNFRECAACEEYLLPAKPEEWVGVILPAPCIPANITGLVLQCGLTAQKTDLAGKSHIPLISLGKKSPTKNPNKPKPQFSVLAHMHPKLPDISAGFRAKESTAQQKPQIYSYPWQKCLTGRAKISLNKEWLHDCHNYLVYFNKMLDVMQSFL